STTSAISMITIATIAATTIHRLASLAPPLVFDRAMRRRPPSQNLCSKHRATRGCVDQPGPHATLWQTMRRGCQASSQQKQEGVCASVELTDYIRILRKSWV